MCVWAPYLWSNVKIEFELDKDKTNKERARQTNRQIDKDYDNKTKSCNTKQFLNSKRWHLGMSCKISKRCTKNW